MGTTRIEGDGLGALNVFLKHLDDGPVLLLLNDCGLFKVTMGNMGYDERQRAYIMLRHEWAGRIFRRAFTQHKPGKVLHVPAMCRSGGSFLVSGGGDLCSLHTESDAQITLCAALEGLAERERQDETYFCKERAAGLQAQRDVLHPTAWARVTDAAKLFAVDDEVGEGN